MSIPRWRMQRRGGLFSIDVDVVCKMLSVQYASWSPLHGGYGQPLALDWHGKAFTPWLIPPHPGNSRDKV
jgi:hypothetical protein